VKRGRGGIPKKGGSLYDDKAKNWQRSDVLTISGSRPQRMFNARAGAGLQGGSIELQPLLLQKGDCRSTGTTPNSQSVAKRKRKTERRTCGGESPYLKAFEGHSEEPRGFLFRGSTGKADGRGENTAEDLDKTGRGVGSQDRRRSFPHMRKFADH